MTLAPLLAASLAIKVHAAAAVGAFALGIVQFAAPKGTLPHRLLGWVWITLMAMVALSAFFIHEIRMVGPFSPIHLLAVTTLIGLPQAVAHARRHDANRHRRAMLSLFVGALVIAGLFTLAPGRIIHKMLLRP